MILFPHPSHYNHVKMPTTPRVLIIGAGLAGLACARRLTQSGIACTVLEGSDDVGGRVRTDRMEGFQLDRGFQVFLTGSPSASPIGWTQQTVISRRRFGHLSAPGSVLSSTRGAICEPIESEARCLRLSCFTRMMEGRLHD